MQYASNVIDHGSDIRRFDDVDDMIFGDITIADTISDR